MEIFKKVKDIENIYQNLISKASETILNEIQVFKDDQEKILVDLIGKKNSLVDTTLNSLKQNINKEINKFEFKLSNLIDKLEIGFKEKVEELHERIITQLGFEF